MKNLYRFLATLTFLIFAATAGSLMLNKAIDKAVKTADKKLDEVVAKYNESLVDSKISHNLYFVNCFPNVCAKASFMRYEKTSTVMTADINEQGQMTEETPKTKTDKYDVGFTEFVVAKYSPLTDKITINLNANNILLLKNHERIGAAYFRKLNYEASSNFIKNYIASLNGDVNGVMNTLAGNAKLEIDSPKMSYEDKRIKADSISLLTKSFDVKDATASSSVDVDIKGFAINNSDEKMDLTYSFAILNLDKAFVQAFTELSNLRIDPKKPELNKEVITEGLKVASVFIDSIKKFDENKTVIKSNNSKFKIYNSKDNKVIADYNVSANLTLDANLDPVGYLNLDFADVSENAKAEIENAHITDKKTGEKYMLFIKNENGNYVSNITFADAKAVINGKEVDIKGQIKALLDFATGIMSLFAMQTSMQ